jgi:hypothetical protein
MVRLFGHHLAGQIFKSSSSLTSCLNPIRNHNTPIRAHFLLALLPMIASSILEVVQQKRIAQDNYPVGGRFLDPLTLEG